MAPRRRLRALVGKGVNRSLANAYPSEPGYRRSMIAQSRAITDQLIKIINAFEDVSEDIMIEALEPTMERARYYTPKDTHALVESAYLEKNSFRGKPRVEIGFAKGGEPDYAAYVHEVLEFKHAAPTQAKFLERAVMEDLDGIYKRMGVAYRRFMS